MTQWPDDERPVPLEDDMLADGAIPEDPELQEDEEQAEVPLPLTPEDVRGDGPDDAS